LSFCLFSGEFGHNDFYPVAVAACQITGKDGLTALKAMLCIDEIRGRLAEVFSLKTYHIDHVVHGAIASAAVYGTLVGANVDQIESAIGMVVAHYIPFRAIRAGEQLSDSKGASAAISTEVAILAVQRAMRGFVGPADIFRNPEAIFRKFKPTQKSIEGDSPFDLALTHSGDDFAVMGMHFKLGLYEHQSAGALQAVINLLSANPHLLTSPLKSVKVVAYQPAFGIIGDPAKRNPTTRQSADHSMVFILSRLIQKARNLGPDVVKGDQNHLWQTLMLTPEDYSRTAINDADTRQYMELITFEHGGPEYDKGYPEGIPTSVVITDSQGNSFDSGLIMFPAGHAANKDADLNAILATKFKRLAELAVDNAQELIHSLENLEKKTAKEIELLYDANIKFRSISSGSAKKGTKRGRETAAQEPNEY
jgi:2-methylcitrate dehydratase